MWRAARPRRGRRVRGATATSGVLLSNAARVLRHMPRISHSCARVSPGGVARATTLTTSSDDTREGMPCAFARFVPALSVQCSADMKRNEERADWLRADAMARGAR